MMTQSQMDKKLKKIDAYLRRLSPWTKIVRTDLRKFTKLDTTKLGKDYKRPNHHAGTPPNPPNYP